MTSQRISLDALARVKGGKGPARQARLKGQIPAVIYGDNKEPLMISLSEHELLKYTTKAGFFTTLCELTVDGKKHQVLARDLQLHPVTDRPEHVDFLRVTDKTTIRVNVPVKFFGEKTSPGLSRGGALSVLNYTIAVICAANKIPEAIDIDISTLDIGDTVHFSDLKLPEGVIRSAVTTQDVTICTVTPPTTLKADEAAPAAAAAAAPAAAGKAAPAKAAPAKAPAKK